MSVHPGSGGNNKFLRPPGTFNHKDRLLNAERRLVELRRPTAAVPPVGEVVEPEVAADAEEQRRQGTAQGAAQQRAGQDMSGDQHEQTVPQRTAGQRADGPIAGRPCRAWPALAGSAVPQHRQATGE